MKKQLPYPFPQDDRGHAQWLKEQDSIADAQIALHQERDYALYLSQQKVHV